MIETLVGGLEAGVAAEVGAGRVLGLEVVVTVGGDDATEGDRGHPQGQDRGHVHGLGRPRLIDVGEDEDALALVQAQAHELLVVGRDHDQDLVRPGQNLLEDHKPLDRGQPKSCVSNFPVSLVAASSNS